MSITKENKNNKPPLQSLLPDVDDVEDIWKMILKRLPSTAQILCDMEKVINDAQNILQNFEIISPSPHCTPSTVNCSNNISTEIDETLKKNNELMKSDACVMANIENSDKSDNHKEFNEFHELKIIENSLNLSCSSSSSSTTIFHNASSTNTFEQAHNESISVDDSLYEIGKINTSNCNDVMKNSESTILIPNRAINIIKEDESLTPRITMKDVMLAPVKPRISTHVDNSLVLNDLHKLETERKQQDIIKTSRQNSPSTTFEKPSSIPRRIVNKPCNINFKKY